MEKEKIHIAVCLDKDYVMPTGVMMYSACVNNQDVDLDFHVLIDESVTERDQQDLRDTIEMFHGKRVFFYHVKSTITHRFPLIKKRLTRAAYYRLFLSDTLLPAIEKVLYLDCDTIVRHSLLPLWNTDLTSYAVGAAMDVSDGDIRIYNRLKYPFTKGYCNSGVLLINLRYWRDHNIVTKFLDYLTNYPDRVLQEDQDVLNVVLQDKILRLPVMYNFQSGFLKRVPMWDYWRHESEVKKGMTDPVIVHFSEGCKPWYIDLQIHHPYRSTFLKYQEQTKWKNCFYDRRSFFMKLRNGVGDIMRAIGIKAKASSPFVDIPLID